MKIHFMGRTVECDECTETDGVLKLYQGGQVILTIANIPDLSAYEAEGGEIRHVLNPLEAALDTIDDLQIELAEAAEEIEAKVAQIEKWREDYLEILADDEAKRARLEQIESLLSALGDAWTLTGLIEFVRSLKAILGENNGAA